jgi:hypothetical protein
MTVPYNSNRHRQELLDNKYAPMTNITNVIANPITKELINTFTNTQRANSICILPWTGYP